MKTLIYSDFEIWECITAMRPDTIEASTKVAEFKYFQEALDYKDYATKRGATVVLRTPLCDYWKSKMYRPVDSVRS